VCALHFMWILGDVEDGLQARAQGGTCTPTSRCGDGAAETAQRCRRTCFGIHSSLSLSRIQFRQLHQRAVVAFSFALEKGDVGQKSGLLSWPFAESATVGLSLG